MAPRFLPVTQEAGQDILTQKCVVGVGQACCRHSGDVFVETVESGEVWRTNGPPSVSIMSWGKGPPGPGPREPGSKGGEKRPEATS